MKRRTHLKLMLSASAGAAILPAPLPAFGKPEKKLGVAIVGLGRYGGMEVAPALARSEHCYLAGVVTGTPEKALKFKQEYQLKGANIYNYERFDELINNPSIDIVYITLPNFMHAEYTIRAFEAGKHVICEKPMALNAEECEAMLKARDIAGKKLQIGYRLYHEVNHLQVRDIGKNEKMGKVKMMQAGLGFRMGRKDSWRIDPEKGGGGAIMDLGVYCIQACRRTVDQLPVSVTAQGYVDEKELYRGVYESVFFQMEFPSGAIANCHTSYSSFVDRFHLACKDGWLDMHRCFSAQSQLGIISNQEYKSIPTPHHQTIAQMDAFAINIKNETPVEASGEEGLIDLQIIAAIKEAIESGNKISVKY